MSWRWPEQSSEAVLGAGVAAVLAVYVFVTTGGVDLGPNTWAEIALGLVATGLGVLAVLRAAPGPAWGLGSVSLFAALATLTVLSISWSVAPDTSWIEANRTVSYLAAFAAAAALARLAPQRWPALLGGLAAGTCILCGYSLLTKVFPATFDPVDSLGRLRLPFDYWNAVGLLAALGLPACLWAGARREHARPLRALAVPGVAILVTALVLSYSRSTLVAVVIGLACWFVVVPLRLRAATVLSLGGIAGGALIAWALATHPLTHDKASLAARTTAGHDFGLVLVLVLVLSTASGFAAVFAMDTIRYSEQFRRRAAIALLGLVALAPLAGVGALAASSRGLTGEISHVWNTLTTTRTNAVGDQAGRLLELGNSRGQYWHDGLTVGSHALLKGVGAGGFATAQGFYSSTDTVAAHAHSYVIETFADLGLLGVALSLALLVSWGLAAARSLGPRHTVGADHITERTGLQTLAVMVLIYGLQSAVDWSWFIPGTTVATLVCAGWLAGRGPLARPIGSAPGRRFSLRASPRTGAAVTAVAAVALLGCWAMLGPLRSADSDSAALTALARGDTAGALSDAHTAASSDPLSDDPLWTMAAIYARLGDRTAVLSELRQAVALQPRNSETWLRLGYYEICTLHEDRTSLATFQTAYRLDLGSLDAMGAVRHAEAALAGTTSLRAWCSQKG